MIKDDYSMALIIALSELIWIASFLAPTKKVFIYVRWGRYILFVCTK